MSLKLEFSSMSKAGPRNEGYVPMAERSDDWIGRQLRRIYRDVMEEPLPDNLADLLERIDMRTDVGGSTSG